MAGAIYSEEQRAVADAFVKARQSANMRQTDLAAKIGKHQSYISDIERGQRRIDVLELFAIAHALGMNPTDLYAHLTKNISADFRL